MKSQSKYNGIKGTIKFISTILSWTALVILIMIAIFVFYYTLGNKIKGEEFNPIFSLYTIVSPSMTPNINVYDVIVSKKINNPDEIKKGDVITFISTSSISKGMTITHRVIDIIDENGKISYKTKGDNNLSPDSSPALYDNVLGKVIFRIPQLGRVQYFLSSKGGWLIAIILPALAIIITDIFKIFKLTKVKNKIEEIEKKDKKQVFEQQELEKIKKEELKKRLKIFDDYDDE